METRFGIEWLRIAIQNDYCVIVNAYGDRQFWDKKYWIQFRFDYEV